jgi:hypothetical protein
MRHQFSPARANSRPNRQDRQLKNRSSDTCCARAFVGDATAIGRKSWNSFRPQAPGFATRSTAKPSFYDFRRELPPLVQSLRKYYGLIRLLIHVHARRTAYRLPEPARHTVMSCSLKRSRSKRMSATHWRRRTGFPGPCRNRRLLHDHVLAGSSCACCQVHWTTQTTQFGRYPIDIAWWTQRGPVGAVGPRASCELCGH